MAKRAVKGSSGGLDSLAIVYAPLGEKLNALFNSNRDEYFRKFKAAVGGDPANYEFGTVVRKLPDVPGSAVGIEPDPSNRADPGRWARDVGGIAEHDRKLLQMVIAGNVFSKEPMRFDFSVRKDELRPRVEVRTTTDKGAHVLVIDIYCGEAKSEGKSKTPSAKR